MMWCFVHSGSQSGLENMQVDTAAVDALKDADGPCVVRVYAWSPWAISLGWNQALEQVDVARATRAGIDLVRRPTGGRAILHAREVTYSVAMIAEPGSVAGLHLRISQALVEGLRLLGVRAALERSEPMLRSFYQTRSSAACFNSTARHEVTVSGKKVIGSAQRRYARSDGKEAILQHGSILLGPEHRRLSEFLCLNEEERRMVKHDLDMRTTDLSTQLGRPVGFEEVAEAVRIGFERAWDIRFQNNAELVR